MNPGDTISRYRIVARIGKGGMGIVYRAEDTRLRRPVALKFLPDSLDEGRRDRFLNEARAAALARHPNICPIHDIEESDGEIFIVMALIEGETLARRISRGPIPPAEAAAIAAQAAAGLAAAHGLGIVHRDIKSSNLMIDGSGHVWIMDFGIALAPEALRLTGEGSSVGTPDYMSPEQAQGREVDARTDLWSLGVVLFEMLTGELPFRREHRAAVAHAVVNDRVPDMPGVPEDLCLTIAKALEKDPADRWPTARAMAAALKGEPEEAATQTIIAAVPRRRRWWPPAAAATVVLLVLGGLGLYRFRTSEPPKPASRRLAILPMSADSSAVANGIEDALRAALAAHPDVTLAPSSSSITTVDAARNYHGVDFALTWSAKPDGGAVEFKVDLMDAVRRRPLDSRTIRYDPKSPVVSRDQAVSQVFRMLGLEPPPAAASAAPAEPEASSSYLEGRGYLARYDLEGNVDKAIASFVKSTAQDTRYALAYAGLAEAYWHKGRRTHDAKWMALATQNAEHAAGLDPGLATARAILGSIYRDSGKREDAIREFQKALDLAPNNAEAARQLGQLYSDTGKFEQAETLFINSTRTRPTDWYGFLLLGNFYADRERYDEAIAALNEAKQLAPDNDLVRYNLGRIFRAHGRYAEAIAELQQALRIRSNPVFYAALGGVYYYQHLYAEAVNALDTALDLSPETYWLWGNLGAYSKWAGNQAKSQAALRRAVELAGKAADANQSDYSVRANLAEYRARLGDAKGALAELDHIPEASRAPFTGRIAIVYELMGERAKAVAVVRQNLKNPASLNRIKDDPDLAAVWRAAR